jgi:hypothetical protein
MDAPTLMHKLIEMERALQRRDSSAIRSLILEAQEGVRALERENEELALENAGLRRRLDAARPSNITYSAHACAEMHGDPSTAAHAFRRQLLSTDPVTDAEPANGDPPRTHLWRTTHFFFS